MAALYCRLIALLCVLFKTCVALDKACPYKPIDLIFALDGSGSEGPRNFQKQLQFVKNFTSQFEIGPNNTRVSLLTFATNVHNEFYLNELHDNVTVMEHISNTTYPDGETNTHQALHFINYLTLSRSHDDRNVSKLVIVLTDGRSLEPDLTIKEANALKTKNPLVTVMAVGIGSHVDTHEVRTIASDANHTFLIDNFDLLHTIQARLTAKACNKCSKDLSDICFVLDSSGSEGKTNFLKQLEFLNLVINEFAIGADATQICVVTFGTRAHLNINFDARYDKDELMHAVLQIPYTDGETMTDMGLSTAYSAYRDHHHGARQNTDKTIIVLTDGRSTEPDRTASQARNIHKHGIETFAIGIGSAVDTHELDTIASDHDHTFKVNHFNELDSIHQQLVDKICAKSALRTTLPPTTTTTTTTTTLPPTTTKAACGLKPADIVFVLDSSDSEGPENFKTEIEFVNRFASQFSIGVNNVQFSVVTFSSDVRNDFYFNTYKTRNEVLHAIRNIAYMGQGTNTSTALHFVRQNNLSPTNGARTNSTKFVIVITDGRSDDPDQTKIEANNLHSVAQVIAIGVGPKVDKAELNAIASNHHAVQVDSFALLQSIQKQLTDLACVNS